MTMEVKFFSTDFIVDQLARATQSFGEPRAKSETEGPHSSKEITTDRRLQGRVGREAHTTLTRQWGSAPGT